MTAKTTPSFKKHYITGLVPFRIGLNCYDSLSIWLVTVIDGDDAIVEVEGIVRDRHIASVVDGEGVEREIVFEAINHGVA